MICLFIQEDLAQLELNLLQKHTQKFQINYKYMGTEIKQNTLHKCLKGWEYFEEWLCIFLIIYCVTAFSNLSKLQFGNHNYTGSCLMVMLCSTEPVLIKFS